MTKFRKYWSVVALVLIFGVGFAMRQLAPTPVQAAGLAGAPVTIQNTPLPVSGTVGVNNFPAFPTTQAVSGTVSVGNFPNPQNVSFSNTSATPLFIRDVDNPAAQPVTGSCQSFLANGYLTCDVFAVPFGKRLVIETVSAIVILPTGVVPTQVYISTRLGETPASFYFVPGKVAANGQDLYEIGQQTRLYSDYPQPVGFTVIPLGTPAYASASVSISGYLVSLP